MSNFSQTSRRICYKIHSECSRQVSIIRSVRIKGRCKFKVRCVLQRGFFRESTCCVKIYTTRVFMREYRTISDTGCLVLFFFFLYIYSFYFSLPISWHFIFDRKFNTRCCWRVQRNKADFNYDAEPRDLKSRLNNIKYKTGAVSKVTMLSTNINLVYVIFPPFLSFLNRELYRYAW